MVKTVYDLTYSDYDEYNVGALFFSEKEAQEFLENAKGIDKRHDGIDEFEIYESADEAFDQGVGTRKK